MDSKDLMYKLIISQLMKDGHTVIAETLSERVGTRAEEAVNDLLHVINSIAPTVQLKKATVEKDENGKDEEPAHADEEIAEAVDDADLKAIAYTTSRSRPRKTVQTVPKASSTENGVPKGPKRKENAVVSKVNPVDMVESDTRDIASEAKLHQAEEAFTESMEPTENPPYLEVQKTEDSPPELHIKAPAVESSKDKAPVLEVQSLDPVSLKDQPPKLQSEDTFTKHSIASDGRHRNPAACNGHEADELIWLDVSAIKAVSEDDEEKQDKQESQGKKRKLSEDGSNLKWIEALNVGKPAKRVKIDLTGNKNFNNTSETFTYKNITYTQPSLVLTRLKNSEVHSAKIPRSTPYINTSTPKTSFQLKDNFPSSKSEDDRAPVRSDSFFIPEVHSKNVSDGETEIPKPKIAKKRAKPRKTNQMKGTNGLGSCKPLSGNKVPVVVLKQCETVSNMLKGVSTNINGSTDRAKRSINLHSDGNEYNEDPWEKINDAELPNLNIVESNSPLGIVETFSVESDSEDECFAASLQDTVENLLDALPTDSPAKSPRAKKKGSLTKRASRVTTEVKKQLDDSFDIDAENPEKELENRPKTAAEKFAELMGE